MKQEMAKMHLLFALRVIIALIMSMFVFVQISPAQGRGSLRVVAINGDGDPLPETIVDICSGYRDECKYSGKTDSSGAIRFNSIPEGIYIVEMKTTGIRVLVIGGVRIEADRENDLGYRTLGPEKDQCLKPGNDCLIDNFDRSRPIESPCLKDKNILRDPDDSPVVLEYDELQRRAIQRAEPEWPKGAKPGYATSIEILIGADGRVLCIAFEPDYEDSISQAVHAAYRKWRFQPILENGAPIAAIGILEFRVPYSYPPK
jgi:hypothetical protein